MSNNYSEQLYGPQSQGEPKGRVPPQATDIEQQILGGCLLEEEAALTAFEKLDQDDFYDNSNGNIFEAMTELFMDDKPLDLTVLESDLKDKGLLDQCGGSGYLMELTRQASSSATIGYHAQIVAEKSKKRKLIKKCTSIIDEAYQPDSDTNKVLDKAESDIFELAQDKNSGAAEHVGEYLQEILEEYETVMEDPDAMEGMFCGLDIDNILTGFKDTLLYILAARPAMGKSALMLEIARGLAVNDSSIGIFSLEMSAKSLVNRLILMESRTNGQTARKGDMSDEDFLNMVDASGRIFDQNIYVDDTPGISIMQMRSKVRHMVQKQGVELIFVDYLQLMSYEGSAGTREEAITKISQGLKNIAKEYEIPVVSLAQLSRAVERRAGDKRPMLSDLRESGSIEQDADAVMFLYRPEYYDFKTTPEGRSTEGLSEVLVKKQRQGPTGMIPLHFIKDYAKFENPSHIYEDEERAPF